MTEPVPEAIRAAIMGEAATPAANVVAFRPRIARLGWAAGGAALAAGLAAAVVILTGAPAQRGLSPGPFALGDGLAEVLETQASGVPVGLQDGREAMVLASFALPEGGFCREVEVIDTEAARIDYAVACREADGWSVRIALSEGTSGEPSDTGFVTAEGEEAQALMSLLDGGDEALPLDPTTEAAAIARNWSSP